MIYKGPDFFKSLASLTEALYGFYRGARGGVSITLGLREGGFALATGEKLGAPFYSLWKERGIYNPAEFQGWPSAFRAVAQKVVNSGGKINFELAGMDIKRSLSGDPANWVGRYTDWELQQILNDKELFSKTDFYLNGDKLRLIDLAGMGIFSPK